MTFLSKGFININACCWWNALLQSLLSCEHFVSTIREENDSNSLTYKALKNFVNLQFHTSENLLCNDNITLLSIFLKELKEKEVNYFKILSSGQQSASEGFTFLIDILKSTSINNLFIHSYEQTIVKKNNISQCISKSRQNNNFFCQFDEEDLLKRGLKQCLISTVNDIKDFKLDNGESNQCLQISRLKRISTIFIVCLNRYKKNRTNISLPNSITIESKNGKIITFHKKACIDHSGNLEGGHYVARCQRNKNIILFNDTILAPTHLETIDNTYITFYQSLSKNI